MNFLNYRQDRCTLVVLVLALFLLESFPSVCALAQQPPLTAIEEPSEKQASSNESIPEVIRSLTELQSIQLRHGCNAYKVDIEAQLIFAAPYWTVFFVQDGGMHAMITCREAAPQVLLDQNVGCKLRIVGIAGSSPEQIDMSSLEIVDPSLSMKPTRVMNLTARYLIPMNTLVEVSSETSEIFVNPDGAILYAMAGTVAIEIEIFGPVVVNDLLDRYTGKTIAQGCLALPPESGRKIPYLLRMMNSRQLRSDSPALPPKQRAKRFKVHSGQVVYSDGYSEFVVVTGDQVREVRSRLAFHLEPGDKVLVHELTRADDNESRTIESTLVEKHSNEPLAVGKSMAVTELLSAPVLPDRVTLTAKMEGLEAEEGVFKLRLSSQGKAFCASIPMGKQSFDTLGVRVGDSVSLTGAPLLDAIELTNKAEPNLKLFVASATDLKFLSTPVRLPYVQIVTFALAGCTLLGIALTWNWLLRRQVQLRTARLNEVSSHLRKAFEAIREGVLVNDREQRISGFNKQFVKMFGSQPSEGQLVNTQLSAIEDQLVNRVEFARIRQHIQDNKSPSTGILELRSTNRTLQVFAGAILDSDGSYQGNLWSFEDITEKLSLENKLIQSQKMEAVGQLSGGIAHDFNNLLTVIRGSLMMMQHAAQNNSPSTEFAESAEIAVDRAAELTQHLLDFSRRSTLQLQVTDANVLLKRIYLMMRRSIDSSIEIGFASTLQPAFINVDVTRLEQVLINLCINARDALPSLGGRIQLGVKRHDLNNSAVIVVADNGSGISQEVQQRMFEPFFTTKQPGCGTGLGLSMAIGVIEQLGGSIECRSELGQGTEFQISLPLADPLTVKAEEIDSEAKTDIQALRIMLVDDEEQIRRLGLAILNSLGHQAVTAANGREAIDLLANDQNFDVVLLDLTMPVMSGKEAFQEIRRRWPSLPIAICSGYLVSVEDWATDEPGSPPSIIAKPYRPDELNTQLIALVQKNRS